MMLSFTYLRTDTHCNGTASITACHTATWMWVLTLRSHDVPVTSHTFRANVKKHIKSIITPFSNSAPPPFSPPFSSPINRWQHSTTPAVILCRNTLCAYRQYISSGQQFSSQRMFKKKRLASRNLTINNCRRHFLHQYQRTESFMNFLSNTQ